MLCFRQPVITSALLMGGITLFLAPPALEALFGGDGIGGLIFLGIVVAFGLIAAGRHATAVSGSNLIARGSAQGRHSDDDDLGVVRPVAGDPPAVAARIVVVVGNEQPAPAKYLEALDRL